MSERGKGDFAGRDNRSDNMRKKEKSSETINARNTENKHGRRSGGQRSPSSGSAKEGGKEGERGQKSAGGFGDGGRSGRERGRNRNDRGNRKGRRDGRDRSSGKRGGRDSSENRREMDRARQLETVKELIPQIDRPMVKGDFEAQKKPLEELRRSVVALRFKSMDDFDADLKARLLTLLLRLGRQDKVQEDSEKEKARQKTLEILAGTWIALSDNRRAAKALLAAGYKDAADALLDDSGDWKGRVALCRVTGDIAGAAKILESEEKLKDALEAYSEIGDKDSILRMLVKIGDEPEIIKALDALPGEKAEAAAIKHGVLDAWAKVLTEREDWPALARLYQSYGKHEIAACAWEQAGDYRKAMKAFRHAGDFDASARCMEKLVAYLIGNNEHLKAGRVLAEAGKLQEAAETAAEKHPEQAHKWFVDGGYKDRALELARREARKAEGHEDYRARATWLERAGDLVSAATLWEGMRDLEKAQRLYEEARAWEPAARCAESRKKMDEAVELYYRANLPEEAERTKLLA